MAMNDALNQSIIDVEEYAMHNSTKERLIELEKRSKHYYAMLRIIGLQRQKLDASSVYSLTNNFINNYNAYNKEQYQFNIILVENTKKIEAVIDEYLTSKYLLVKTNQFENYVVDAVEKRYTEKMIPLLIERLELEKIQKVDIIRHKILAYQILYGLQSKNDNLSPSVNILKPKVEMDNLGILQKEEGEEINKNLANCSITNKKEYEDFVKTSSKISEYFSDKEMREMIELLKQAPFDAIKPTKVLTQTPREIAVKAELYLTCDENTRKI